VLRRVSRSVWVSGAKETGRGGVCVWGGGGGVWAKKGKAVFGSKKKWGGWRDQGKGKVLGREWVFVKAMWCGGGGYEKGRVWVFVVGCMVRCGRGGSRVIGVLWCGSEKGGGGGGVVAFSNQKKGAGREQSGN